MDGGAAAAPSGGSEAGADGGGESTSPTPDTITDTEDLPIAPVYGMYTKRRRNCFYEGFNTCRNG
jgi:hypothetical protein